MAYRDDYINFVKSYDVIRSFLRQYYIVGMSSNKILNSKKDYNNNLRRVKNFVEDEFLEHENINGIKYNRFCTEKYTKSHNFLFDSYLIKTINLNELKAYFLILQKLSKCIEIEGAKLNSELSELLSNEGVIDVDDSLQFIDRLKNKIVNLGIIDKTKQGRKTVLSIAKDVFEDFSNDEIVQIINAVNFYCGVSVISVLGYSLIDVLKDYLYYERHSEFDFESIFKFQQAFLNNILDDQVVNLICEAIKNKTNIVFKYKNKRVINVEPKQVITEYIYGRQYLIGVDLEYKNYCKYRIDKISNCKLSKNAKISEEDLSKDKARQVLVEIDFFIDEIKEEYIIRRINRERNGVIKKIEQNHFLYSEELEDYLSMKPWIRSFGNKARVRASENHDLDISLDKEYEELLKKYNINIEE